MYTMYLIEGGYHQLKKPTSKGVFPSDESLIKILYLVTIDVTKNWTIKVQNITNFVTICDIFLKIEFQIIFN